MSASALPVVDYYTCPECDGEGGYWVLDTARIRATTITPPEKWERCERCDGEGELVREDDEESTS